MLVPPPPCTPLNEVLSVTHSFTISPPSATSSSETASTNSGITPLSTIFCCVCECVCVCVCMCVCVCVCVCVSTYVCVTSVC